MQENEDDLVTSIQSKQKLVLILSIMCMTVVFCIMIRNVSRYVPERSNIFFGMFIFTMIVIIIWVIVFTGAIRENYGLLYFGWAMWAILFFVWMVFLVGCITPTRCWETLWLMENTERREFEIDTHINFYYHDYHEPLPDRLPKSMDHEHGHRDNEDIPYVIKYEPMIESFKFYIPWKSPQGAINFIFPCLLIFTFFVITLHILKTYARQLYKYTIKKHSLGAMCKC